MTLDITILKVAHSGADEAKKLVPYIRQCDVYSPEAAFETKHGAEFAEREWVTALTDKNMYGQAMQNLVSLAQSAEMPDGAYALEEQVLLLRERKPKWHVERFSSRMKISPLTEKYRGFFVTAARAFDALRKGDVNAYVQWMYEATKAKVEVVDERDRHISAQLLKCEDGIRKTYPHIEDDLIKITVRLGALHRPEHYLDRSVQVVSLTGPDMRELTSLAIRDGASPQEVRRLILIYGAEILSNDHQITIPEDVQNMNIQELEQILSTKRK